MLSPTPVPAESFLTRRNRRRGIGSEMGREGRTGANLEEEDIEMEEIEEKTQEYGPERGWSPPTRLSIEAAPARGQQHDEEDSLLLQISPEERRQVLEGTARDYDKSFSLQEQTDLLDDTYSSFKNLGRQDSQNSNPTKGPLQRENREEVGTNLLISGGGRTGAPSISRGVRMASRRRSVIRLLDTQHTNSPPATDVATQSSTPKLKARGETIRTPNTPILSLEGNKRKFNQITPPLEDRSEDRGYAYYPHVYYQHLSVPKKRSSLDSIRRKGRFFCPEVGQELTEPWAGQGACSSPERKSILVEMPNGRNKNVDREIGNM